MTTTIGAAAEEMLALEERRGLLAAELGACESELGTIREGKPSTDLGYGLGALALAAVLEDEEAAAELAERAGREKYLEERITLCEAAISYANRRLEGLRRTYLGGYQARDMPLEEMPEVLRERVRRTREAREGS